MKNQQLKLSRLVKEKDIENNKQALKAIQICRELMTQIRIMKKTIQRLKK